VEVLVKGKRNSAASDEKLQKNPEILLMVSLRAEQRQRHNAQPKADQVGYPVSRILADHDEPHVIVESGFLAQNEIGGIKTGIGIVHSYREI